MRVGLRRHKPCPARLIPAAVDLLKVFYEDALALEHLADDADPDARGRDHAAPSGPDGALDYAALEAFLKPGRYARLYLAGSHRPPGGPDRVGLTALEDARLYTAPLLAAFGSEGWQALKAGSSALAPEADPPARLRNASGTAALVVGQADPADVAGAAAPDRRRAVPALRRVLDAGAVLLLPEPAHDGHDWTVFAARPLRAPFTAALQSHPAPHARRFVLPYQRARGEHRFYFERWQLEALPAWIEEV